MYIFEKNIYIFRHLKLEIALAIPASNDEIYNWNNSAGQGLSILNAFGILIVFIIFQPPWVYPVIILAIYY